MVASCLQPKNFKYLSHPFDVESFGRVRPSRNALCTVINLMADFQLVDPQGWEWDLQSVRKPLFYWLRSKTDGEPRYTRPT